MKIVKYFNREKNWKNYQAGSFKFGTLKGYGQNSFEGDRFSDADEGKIGRIFGRGEGVIENLAIGDLKIEKLVSFPVGEPGSQLRKIWDERPPAIIRVESSFNCNIFCVTFGEYDRAHHLKMLNGEVGAHGEYLGNAELNAFAEIDLLKFIAAVRTWVMKNSVYREVRDGVVEFLRYKTVKYGNRDVEYPLSAARNAARFPDSLIDRMVFTKEERYAVERVFRVAVTMTPSHELDQAVDLFPRSFALKRSIIRMGHL